MTEAQEHVERLILDVNRLVEADKFKWTGNSELTESELQLIRTAVVHDVAGIIERGGYLSQMSASIIRVAPRKLTIRISSVAPT
jgi:hypothetical protein